MDILVSRLKNNWIAYVPYLINISPFSMPGQQLAQTDRQLKDDSDPGQNSPFKSDQSIPVAQSNNFPFYKIFAGVFIITIAVIIYALNAGNKECRQAETQKKQIENIENPSQLDDLAKIKIKKANNYLLDNQPSSQQVLEQISQLESIARVKMDKKDKLQEQLNQIKQLQHALRKKAYTTDKFDYWGGPPQRKGQLRIPKNARAMPDDFDSSSTPVDVQYESGEYFPLPVDYLRERKDQYNQTIKIADALYPSKLTRQERKSFHISRYKELHSYKDSHKWSLHLAKYNNALDQTDQREGTRFNQQEWERLNSKFALHKITKELPMCILVPGYNNNANFRIQYNLNSIFSQNYSNYFVVVVDDHSSDGSIQIYRRYFAFHRINKAKYILLENQRRETALPNIHINAMKYCSLQSIVVTIDADDEFIGRNVLQVFNWAYQTLKAGVVYSNFAQYGFKGIEPGFTKAYTEEEKTNNKYRDVKMKFSHLRSYRNQLSFLIDPANMQDQSGKLFTITYDQALFFPLMELSCARVHKIEGEYHYLYMANTGLNDFNNPEQQKAKRKIIKKPKMACDKDFDQRMNSL